jgi:hypothetical protein
MPNNYLERMYKLAYAKTIQITAETNAQILEAYKLAGVELVKKFRRTRDGSATRAYYASYIRSLSNAMNTIIKSAGLSSAEVPASVQKLMTEKIFKDAGIDSKLVPNFNETYGNIPKKSVARVLNGEIYKDGTTLSTRIWGSSLQAGADIQGIVNSGLTNKLSATEMAKTLEAYVDPAIRKTWDRAKIKEVLGDGYARWNKNLEYNSLRLARTTITHAAQTSLIESCRKNPFIKSVKWHSVLKHGRTCDICRARDGKIFLLDEVPLDHPNGLCYQTSVIDGSLDEIAGDLKKQVNSSDGDLNNLADLLKGWVDG